jgi:tetratricopeptide (TPR) repeat protein
MRHPAFTTPAQSRLWRACTRWGPALALVLLTIAVYWPALRGRFLWDDDSWTTLILPLLQSGDGLRRIWFEPTALQQYYPLTATTFWFDYHLFGLNPAGYHFGNILLHGLGAGVFHLLLRRLAVPGAWLAAAVFALHPVHVESVAWITERKNVLSALFFVGALLAYVHHAFPVSTPQPASADPAKRQMTNDGAGEQSRSTAYWVAFALFCAAMFSKTAAFALPATMLLLCWWQRGRITRRDLADAAPFFAVAVALGLMTAWLEKNHLGAGGADWAFTPAERLLMAGRACWFYVGKILWPAPLIFVYPRWNLDAGAFVQWLFPIAAVAAVGALWSLRRRVGRGPLAGVLFFGGSMVPVLGFMNAFFMFHSFVCDHWQYLADLGLIPLFTAAAVRAASRVRGVPARTAGLLIAAVLLPLLAGRTVHQISIYADSETLWRDTLRQNPNAALAWNNLGVICRTSGRSDEGARCYEQAVRSNPRYREAELNLGNVRLEAGRLEEARALFADVARAMPAYPPPFWQLAHTLDLLGQEKAAAEIYHAVLRRDPGYLPGLERFAFFLATTADPGLRNPALAVELAERGCALCRWQDFAALDTLAVCLASAEQPARGEAAARQALALAEKSGDPAVIAQLTARLQNFRSGQPLVPSPDATR